MHHRFLPLFLLGLLHGFPLLADDLDDFIRNLLRKRQVPGLSLAIIEDGKIRKAMAYGFTDKTHSTPLTIQTLFQAGSISKSVAAVGALTLVDQGKLLLDEDVNVKLKTWKVSENEFTKDHKVTLRGLLSHTAGLTVQGFPGYEVGKPLPSLVQILDGTPPANTPAVRVDFVPGTQWRYSGGGYTVLQHLLMDVTAQSFPAFLQQAVLGPLAMQHSTFEQPLAPDLADQTATAHTANRNQVPGRWHIYPEMAAAGLWTTPSDLARAIGIQQAYAGKKPEVLSQPLTQQMLTDQKNSDGLGVFLQGQGATRQFGHGGRDEGFDALLTASVEQGQGVVMMINANDNSRMMSQIVDAIAQHYRWDGFSSSKPIPRTAARVAPSALAAFQGRYEFANNQMMSLQAQNNRLFSLVDGLIDEEFVPLSAGQFASTDRDVLITFHPAGNGAVRELTWKEGGQERTIPRLGPLFFAPKARPDPAPGRTRQIRAILKAMTLGGSALTATSGVSSGAQAAFRDGFGKLTGFQSLTYVYTQEVGGRGIERHGSAVEKLVTYRLCPQKPVRYVLVHLTADGLVTDCDVVDH
ncbi:serine hydrolase domain-containing protein [Larkinella insperata]|uniref:Serine hydrolase domain-containing protein n=1 Tax=Larkinella insperata TaxID=332158 RepID=A0ABW3Q0U5_9BACT